MLTGVTVKMEYFSRQPKAFLTALEAILVLGGGVG